MIKWYIKYLLSTILGIMPFRHKLHQLAQKIIGSHVLDEEEMLSRALELLLLSKKHMNGDIHNLNLLEIGTGWYPYVPIISYLLGARNIVTVDINPWLTHENLHKTIKSVIKNSCEIQKSLAVDEHSYRSNINKLKEIVDAKPTNLSILKELNINYLPGMDVNDIKVSDQDKFDIILSANVLEHIDPDMLAKIYRSMIEVSSETGIMVHRFNPADHFAKLSGSTLTFLTVSDFVWNTFLGGRGISYHNRLRASEHVGLHNSNGWSIQFWANAVDQRAVEGVKSGAVKLTDRYLNMEIEDVCTFYCWLVSGKGKADAILKPKTVKWVTDIL